MIKIYISYCWISGITLETQPQFKPLWITRQAHDQTDGTQTQTHDTRKFCAETHRERKRDPCRLVLTRTDWCWLLLWSCCVRQMENAADRHITAENWPRVSSSRPPPSQTGPRLAGVGGRLRLTRSRSGSGLLLLLLEVDWRDAGEPTQCTAARPLHAASILLAAAASFPFNWILNSSSSQRTFLNDQIINVVSHRMKFSNCKLLNPIITIYTTRMAS